MYIAMYSIAVDTQWKECMYVSHVNHISPRLHIHFNNTALLHLKEEEATSMYIYTYVCIYAQNSVYTVHTYVNTEGISVLHWPHIVTAWASLDCTTHQQKHSHFQYDHWITVLQMCTSYILYTVLSGFLVPFAHCTPQSLTHVINILELGTSHEFQLQ